MRIEYALMLSVSVLVAACGGGGDGGGSGGGGERTVASVQVEPQTRQLVVGEEITASARLLDAGGNVLGDRVVQWSSDDATVVAVSAGGVVRGIAPGATYVNAASEGKSGRARITVVLAPVASLELDVETANLEEGTTWQIVATLRDAAQRPLSGRGVQWSSSDQAIVSVDSGGLVTALRPGRVTITASAEGKSDSAVVLVTTENDYDLLYDGWSGVAGQSPELYRVDIRHPSGMPARVAPGEGARDPAPSPDGTRIAFVKLADGRPQLFVVDADGTNETRLTFSAAHDDQPAWSPDGETIAFRRRLNEPSAGADIWVIDADGTSERNLTEEHGATSQADPAWSPLLASGEARIAYSSQTPGPEGTAHVWTMLVDGSDKRQITVGEVYDSEPAWSPDGQTIVFNRADATAYLGLQRMDAAGRGVRPLMSTRLAFGQFAPVWSPDGKLIAFASKHEDGRTYQIYTIWADGSKLARRTFDDTDKANPAWTVRVP